MTTDNPTATHPRPAPSGTRTTRHKSPYPALLTVTYLLFTVMLGGTLPTPLYPLYAQRLHLSPLLVALVFAAYALGILGPLLLAGGLSDHIGRRRVLVPAVATGILSCAVFAAFPTLPGLLAGRVLSGISVGLTTGAATAYLGELHPRPPRAALVAAVTNMVGLGVGPLLSGLLISYAPHPLVTPYAVLAVLLLPGALVLALPETVRTGDAAAVRLRPQRLAVPADARPAFTAAAVAVFGSFAVLGLLSALAGKFLAEGLHTTSPVMAGTVVCCAFGCAGLAQLAAARLAPRPGAIAGMVVVPLGLAAIVAALPASSLPLFLLGAAVAGAGGGVAFRSGLALVVAQAPAGRAGELVSGYFVAAYLGLAVPAIGVGLLVTATSLGTAATAFAAVVTVLALVSITVTAKSRRATAG
ncbi:MFS transporter [Streptomyces sp. GS7]|uniref:MFS transporter n=1 Tax=Streptomyces sp. GS7 TaxID=2692234 RepID=UPI0013193640|nr:MFS transporter [Streptomyces sp. GS7]QHC22578.1 MFS transporter [Streptomyces sp. GS7]